MEVVKVLEMLGQALYPVVVGYLGYRILSKLKPHWLLFTMAIAAPLFYATCVVGIFIAEGFVDIDPLLSGLALVELIGFVLFLISKWPKQK